MFMHCTRTSYHEANTFTVPCVHQATWAPAVSAQALLWSGAPTLPFEASNPCFSEPKFLDHSGDALGPQFQEPTQDVAEIGARTKTVPSCNGVNETFE